MKKSEDEESINIKRKDVFITSPINGCFHTKKIKAFCNENEKQMIKDFLNYYEFKAFDEIIGFSSNFSN